MDHTVLPANYTIPASRAHIDGIISCVYVYLSFSVDRNLSQLIQTRVSSE